MWLALALWYRIGKWGGCCKSYEEDRRCEVDSSLRVPEVSRGGSEVGRLVGRRSPTPKFSPQRRVGRSGRSPTQSFAWRAKTDYECLKSKLDGRYFATRSSSRSAKRVGRSGHSDPIFFAGPRVLPPSSRKYVSTMTRAWFQWSKSTSCSMLALWSDAGKGV